MPIFRHPGISVVCAGTGINLALGILYTWSVISGAVPDTWGWSTAQKALPYSVACLVFSLAMIPAGLLQDRIAPKWVATIGGTCIGLGCILAALAGSSLPGFILGFGLLGGIGIGFGYAAATPPAVKWFPPNKTGLIAGIVVAGFGLASVYAAPLATALLHRYSVMRNGVVELGISSTMMLFGIIFFGAVVILSQLLKNPPEERQPEKVAQTGKTQRPNTMEVDIDWKQMIRTPRFWLLWVMYFCGAGVGLMIISTAKSLGSKALGEYAFYAVVILAIGNAGGRIGAGMLSDRIGRRPTLMLAYLLQALMVILLVGIRNNPLALLVIIMIAGANYGANLSLFPAACKDSFGIRRFGLNYGILFTAWGMGGLVLPYIHGKIQDTARLATGALDPSIANRSYYLAAVLLVIAALISLIGREKTTP